MYYKGIMVVLSVAIAVCMGAEENRRLSELDGDASYRQSQQLLRFDRVYLPNWTDEDLDKPGQNRFVPWPWEPVPPNVADNALIRDRRQFYRFGRDLQQSRDKRFLRFGRSWQPDVEDYSRVILLPQEEPLYRKRRSAESDSHSGKFLHRTTRSAENNHNNNKDKYEKDNKDTLKIETNTDTTKNTDGFKTDKQLDEELDMDKRFMRFGKRFMRFGRGDEDDEGDNERRVSESNQDLDKRFMRFGKRFMRFGRGNDEDESNQKRFMRFGKSGDYRGDAEKRFMRFGKRFMRFGKRFMRFGRRDEDNDDDFVESDKNDDGLQISKRSR